MGFPKIALHSAQSFRLIFYLMEVQGHSGPRLPVRGPFVQFWQVLTNFGPITYLIFGPQKSGWFETNGSPVALFVAAKSSALDAVKNGTDGQTNGHGDYRSRKYSTNRGIP